jgi:very-short-patch-repair endonuclease
MPICYVCKKELRTRNSLSAHLKKEHSLLYIDYVVKYEGFKIPTCFCGKNRQYTNRSIKFKVTCGDRECLKRYRSNGCKEETKEKIRKARFEYLKKQLGETAWERKRLGKMSYLESWFYDNVVLKHNLLEKYDIVNEYPEYPYFIDFAFLSSRIAVELDGMQHFRNKKNQDRDIKKQKYLESIGWKIFRIRFDELSETKIEECLYILSNPITFKPKSLEPKLFKLSSYRKKNVQNREQYYAAFREKFLSGEKDNIEKVKNSNIDFTMFGWVGKVAKLLGKHPQKVNGWIKKCCPDIIEKSFKRAVPGSTPHHNSKPYVFSYLEKEAYNRGYRIIGNNIINKKGEILSTYLVGEYPSVTIVINGKSRHLKLHRLKAYLLYGDSIFRGRSKVIFKNGNKLDLTDNNIMIDSRSIIQSV